MDTYYRLGTISENACIGDYYQYSVPKFMLVSKSAQFTKNF